MQSTELFKYKELDDFLEDPENKNVFLEIYQYVLMRTATKHVEEHLISSFFIIAIRLFDKVVNCTHPELCTKEIVQTGMQWYKEECGTYPSPSSRDQKDLYSHYPIIVCKILLSLYDNKGMYIDIFLKNLENYLEPEFYDRSLSSQLIEKLVENGYVFHFENQQEKSYYSMSKQELIEILTKDKNEETIKAAERRSGGVCIKVTIRAFEKMWSKLGMSKAKQKEKVDFISTFCGFTHDAVRKNISGKFDLTERDHKSDVDKVNEILLNIGIKSSIKLDRNKKK